MARDITGGSGSRKPPASGQLTAELHRTWLRAGAPSYRELERRMERSYSRTTIWRAFTDERLPRWDLLLRILRALGVDHTQISTVWREMWYAEARQARTGRYADEPDTQHTATAAPATWIPGEGPRRLSALTPPPAADGQTEPASQECEDCGALIGDLVRHQAWHWRIERQLSRATLRAIDGTGQLTRCPAATPPTG